MKKLIFLVIGLGILSLVGCKKAIAVQCTDSPNVLKLSGTETTEVQCPANCSGGSLWGTDIYTTDSSVCRAAIHAGVIKADKGGKVKVTLESGKPKYEGTERNGITSSSWNSYGSSFRVK